jgi:hypothetical protein
MACFRCPLGCHVAAMAIAIAARAAVDILVFLFSFGVEGIRVVKCCICYICCVEEIV